VGDSKHTAGDRDMPPPTHRLSGVGEDEGEGEAILSDTSGS